MITSVLFDGELGSGKTLSAVMMALKWSCMAGVPLLSNATIAGAEKIQCGDDFAKISQYRESGSIVLLDEAQSLLDSRTSQTKGQIKFTEFLAYLRKMRCVIIFTTPAFSYVDLRVRERLSYRIHVSSMRDRIAWDIYNPITEHFMYSKILNKENLKGFYGFYDTYEIVPVIDLPTDLRALISAAQ